MGQFHCLLNKGIIPLSIFSSVELQQVTRSSARLTFVSEADERDGSSKQKTLAASLTNARGGGAVFDDDRKVTTAANTR